MTDTLDMESIFFVTRFLILVGRTDRTHLRWVVRFHTEAVISSGNERLPRASFGPKLQYRRLS